MELGLKVQHVSVTTFVLSFRLASDLRLDPWRPSKMEISNNW